jgi:hypothetical protein
VHHGTGASGIAPVAGHGGLDWLTREPLSQSRPGGISVTDSDDVGRDGRDWDIYCIDVQVLRNESVQEMSDLTGFHPLLIRSVLSFERCARNSSQT